MNVKDVPLTRVEHGSVHQVVGRPGDVNVAPNVRRVLSAQLESNALEPLAFRRCSLDALSAGDRSGERDKVDARVGGQLERVCALEVEDLEDVLGQTGGTKSRLESDGRRRRLRTGLEEESVPCQETGDDRVDEAEVRIAVGGRKGVKAEREKQHQLRFLRTR